MFFIDLSHTIENGLITYKGFPAPVICDYLSREQSRQHYAPGTEFQIGKIEMVANTGTYIDVPFHRYAGGKDFSRVEVDRFTGLEGMLIDASRAEGRAIGEDFFKPHDLRNKAVLVRTDWSRHWATEQYFEGHPFLTAEAAEHLRSEGALLVGIDSLNIDDTSDKERPVHSILLAAEILIVEHLCNLDRLPAGDFFFHAVPPKIKGMGSFPVRAFAAIEEDVKK
jgi:arylformamidase